MEKLFELILELENIRTIPQFLYYDIIYPTGVIKLKEEIFLFQKENPDIKEIDFILQSSGGSADDAYRIIKLLRSHFEIVNIVIPFWAKSAATLLSFGGTKIIMDEFGEFGPLDTQLPKEKEDSPEYDRESALIDQISLKSIEDRGLGLFKIMFTDIYRDDYIPISKNVLSEQLLNYTSKFYEPLLRQINPYKIGDKQRKLDIAVQYARKILTRYNSISHVLKNLLIDSLVNDYPDHGFIIDQEEISKYLKNVFLSSMIDPPEYGYKLSEINSYFMCVEKDEKFIGFVNENLITKKSNTNLKKINSKIKTIKPNGETNSKVFSERE